jgi:hypothetical protein
MAERGSPPVSPPSGRSRFAGALAYLGAGPNRGLLLDLSVFALNLSVMLMLSRWFVGLIRQASSGEGFAQSVLFSLAVALFVLAPLGATLKRWHHHEGLKGRKISSDPAGGCLFNPIFYFCLTAVIFASVNAFILQNIYGKKEPNAGVFVSSIFVGLALMILHTWLVYRYFSPPKRPPRVAFLRSPASGVIGDACLFANMMLFQLIWNLLSLGDLPPPGGVVDFGLRFLVLCFLALLLYFPPRMFYLAEDIGRGRTWVMIFLANSPILVRVLLGSSSGVQW